MKTILRLKRKFFCEDYTIGTLYLNGDKFCDTLEDCDRLLLQTMPIDQIKQQKIYGETAIPKGKYKVTLSVSPRFGRTLPRLENVPGFEGILIHRGNTAKDTHGCILVGENLKKGMVVNSTHFEAKLIGELKKADEIEIIIE